MSQESLKAAELPQYKMVTSIFWLLFLSIGVQIIIGIVAGIVLGMISLMSAMAVYPF